MKKLQPQNQGQLSISRYFMKIVSELHLIIKLYGPECKVDLRASIGIYGYYSKDETPCELSFALSVSTITPLW
jgi:hypothetical protein